MQSSRPRPFACIHPLVLLLSYIAAAPGTVRLNDGTVMPTLSFSGSMSWRDNATKTSLATKAALDAGFRSFYIFIGIGTQSQKAMLDVIKAEGVPRQELYLTGVRMLLSPPGCASATTDTCTYNFSLSAAQATANWVSGASPCFDEASCYAMTKVAAG